jgi:tctex1 domain-containing protein 2
MEAKPNDQLYQLKPGKHKDKFKPGEAKEIIKAVLEKKLDGIDLSYETDKAQSLCKDISEMVKNELRDLKKPRYKIIVQVYVGQQNGQGVRIANRCFWDYDTDNCAFESYSNEHIFCLVIAYGVYTY